MIYLKKAKQERFASDMSKKDVDKFAGTKHKGLPKKVKKEQQETIKKWIQQEIRKALQEITVKKRKNNG